MPLPALHSGIKLDEVLPAPLDHVSGVTTSTALVQRKRLRLVPQTSATANPGDIINFLIQDPGMLDLQSAVFHANITVNGGSTGANASACLDDGPAWLRQLVVQVDGQNLETQDRVNKLTNMETYMTCSPALYNRQLSFAGYWKFNNDLAAYSDNTTRARQFQDISGNSVAATEFYNTGTGWDVAVPLGLVSHVFRSERLFPSRFANNLLIQMQLEAATAALFTTGSATASTYQLNSIYLSIDSVTLNPAFTAFLQDQVMDPNGSGITLPFETKISAQGQSQNNNAENTFVVSRASKNLKRIAVVQQPTAMLGASATLYPEISTFPSAGFNRRGQAGASVGQVQLYIAGQYYPLFPAQGSDAFMVAVQAYNGHPLVDSEGPIVNYRTWGTTTGTTSTGTVNSGSAKWSDSWIWAYDLSKMIGSSHDLEHDGVDSTGNSQIQITIKTGAAECSTPADGAVSYTPLVEMVGMKYLTIANGELTIQG